MQFGVSTLERWYYAARRADDPVAILRNRVRADSGRFPSLMPPVIATLTLQYLEHPGWSVQLHYDNLRVALSGTQVALPFRRATPKRLPMVEHVGALWHLDFHHGLRSVLTRAGAWIKPKLLGVIDDRSRLVCHLQRYLDETAESLVHGLAQDVAG